MRVLALLSDRPNPPVSGSRVRNYTIWTALKRLGVDVKVLGTDYSPDAQEPAHVPEVESQFFRLSKGPLPLHAWRLYSQCYHQYPVSDGLLTKVDETIATWKPDIIHAEELRMAKYLPRFRGLSSDMLHSITLHNVERDLYERIGSSPFRLAPGLAKQAQLWNLERFELRGVSITDIRLAYSNDDQRRYAEIYPTLDWQATRNGTNALGITPAPQPVTPKVLLLGTLSYGPNRTGVLWFLKEILPLLAAGTEVTVAGSSANDDLKRTLRESGVRFVDRPLELQPLYDEHAVIAVPLLEGSGTRGKILEALAFERVVVSTTKGAEGLGLGEDEGVLLADTAEAIASRINQVLMAPDERAERARRGREAVIARFDWSVVANELLEVWQACMSR